MLTTVHGISVLINSELLTIAIVIIPIFPTFGAHSCLLTLP